MKRKAKTKPDREQVTSEKDDALRVGLAIRRLRKQRRMKQAELAGLVDMQPAQLCNSEKGNNLPSIKTLRRICDALGVTVNDLVYPKAFLERTRGTSLADGIPNLAKSGDSSTAVSEENEIGYMMSPSDKLYAELKTKGIARCTHSLHDGVAINERIIAMLQSRITDYMVLENMCGVCKHATIPLNTPFTVDNDGAEQLASRVRMHCGIGSAIVFDYVEMLENNGLRILFSTLPAEVQSISFYDAANINAFIVIEESLNEEKQLFNLMVELAKIYLFTRNENAVVHDTDATRHFAKRFAAEMLMPREAVKTSIAQIGILPDQWNYEMVLRIKARFGVSAEAFAYRLEELNLLPKDGKLLETLVTQIQNHYAKTQYAEPGINSRKTTKNARFNDLLICAKLNPENAKEVRVIEAKVKKNYPIDLSIPISEPPAKRIKKIPNANHKKSGRPKKKI